jgi:serine/threonine protein kinase
MHTSIDCPIIIAPDSVKKPSLGMGRSGLVSRLKDSDDQVLKSPLRYDLSRCNDKSEIQHALYEEVLSLRDIQREKAVYECLDLHPCLLRYYKSTLEGIYLEYMPLGTLGDYLKSTSAHLISTSQRRCWATQVAAGLQHLHLYNIIWSDPSTRNCLLASDLSLRICDFAGSGMPGTPPTVSPSVRFCKNWDESASIESDHFGLGSIMFEIYTGAEPFKEFSETEVHTRYTAGQFPSTEGLAVGAIISHCWENKYKNCADILDSLESDNV